MGIKLNESTAVIELYDWLNKVEFLFQLSLRASSFVGDICMGHRLLWGGRSGSWLAGYFQLDPMNQNDNRIVCDWRNVDIDKWPSSLTG